MLLKKYKKGEIRAKKRKNRKKHLVLRIQGGRRLLNAIKIKIRTRFYPRAADDYLLNMLCPSKQGAWLLCRSKHICH